MLFCETRYCIVRRHNDLDGHSNFSSIFLVSLFCAWNITAVEINSGVHLLKSLIWGHAYKLFKAHCPASVRSRFFADRVLNVWNALPQETNFSSLAVFRQCIEKK